MQAYQRMLDPTANGLHSGESPLLRAIGLTKRYGDFLANDSIDIDIWPKEIHALLGENGAGKSTLVKAIYGLIQPSAGEIRWQGEPIVLSGPSEARSRGIGMVFQHFSLFDNLTVAENVALGLDGRNPSRTCRRGWSRCRRPMACRSIPGARSGSCRSASASASRSCAR